MYSARLSCAAFGLFLFLHTISLPALAADQPLELSGDPAKGRDVFIGKGCIKCHSIWNSGGKLGPDLTRIGMGKSLLGIAGSLWTHTPKMVELMEKRGVSRPLLSEQEMQDLVFYLYYLNYFNEPGDPAVGQRTFSEKGCINCHSVAGSGGSVGPRLDTYEKYSSPLFVAQAMWNHGPKMAAAMRQAGVTKPRFDGKDMADLLAFIRRNARRPLASGKLLFPGDPTVGRQLFTSKGCVECHSIRGRGGKLGPDLAARGETRSVTDTAGDLWNHGGEMWTRMRGAGVERPIFAGNEMADLVAYLYFAKAVGQPGNRQAGKTLFVEKGCGRCHSVGGGKGIGPDLRASRALNSPMSLIAAMWNHAGMMESAVKEKSLPWPKFEGDEMADLMEHLRSEGKLAGITK